ncbi:glycosyl transferase, family 25 [Colwellia chukchiensis]|uniref:Glycosyl transferase, family 25 n=1 Tax=Colwellia chukchiensis TaxID=641665 RepID=A0A1H7J1X1_9GAMM|nr:glycosyltransferase family 25 protein [Colwellia chukchiensis]SEK68753.1 glycosyl transferase, family 25 [Colwellia chukchiensis]
MNKINACPVYVVNLDAAPARMSTMAAQLNTLGIAYQRITAVNGLDLSAQEIASSYSKTLNRQHFRYNLSLGEIGCYMSHRKIWQLMLDEGIEFAVVLEDDLVIKDKFRQLFAQIDTLKQFDLIKLADNRNYPAAQKLGLANDLQLVNYHTIPNCTTGYTISLNGAKKLLARKKFYRPVDIDIQFCKELNLSVYGLQPYPISENRSFESDIAAFNGGRHGKKTTSLIRNIKYRLALWYLRKSHLSGRF